MADCKNEKFNIADKVNDKTELKNNENEKDCAMTSEINDKSTEIIYEQRTGEKSKENCDSIDNATELPKIASSHHNGCISSEENSPIKTGFLRSFIEKKHLISQNFESSENGQCKIDSPVEAQPKTPSTDDSSSLCKWQDCDVVVTSRSDLSQHVHQLHVEPMTMQDVFVCLWQGCKVFNKPSCSHSWLAKHMNSHTGDKPFKCMIDSCTMSFSSCEGLSRHVAGHFNEPKPVKRPRGEGKDSPNKKLMRKRRVKVIRRRHPVEVKEDFVNPKTVETIKQQLPQMVPICSYQIGIDGTKIALQSTVIGKRINEKNGETNVLLHWVPDDLIPDEWVSVDDYEKHKTKTVCISSLPNHIRADLDPAFYRRLSHRTHRRK